MPGFFMKPKKAVKRKLTGKKNTVSQKKLGKEIESDDDESIISGDEEVESAEAESDGETAVEKRYRLAKEYISKLEEKEEGKGNGADIDKDAIAHRLQQDALEDSGRLEKFIANRISPDHANIKVLRGHQLSVTCLAISSDARYIFSSSKDGTIIKWDACSFERKGKICGKKKSQNKLKGHVGQILCLAISGDFQFLASGGHDYFINIWNPENLMWLHTFKGHRNFISGLAFQQKQHQLFSASFDKTIKVWNLDQMAYVETLFGHEDAVLGIDSLMRNRAVSCGGRDRSVHQWKIPEESQLVFQSNMGSSFDCITMLNEEYFLTGGDDGSLSIFFVKKKKPITLRTNAHTKTIDSPASSCNESWITSVACLPYTDLVASGSCDGCIKFWRCEKSFRSILPIKEIKISGFVNSLKFTSKGDYLVAGIGQEHRLGRWWKIKEAKNSVCIIPLNNVENNSEPIESEFQS